MRVPDRRLYKYMYYTYYYTALYTYLVVTYRYRYRIYNNCVCLQPLLRLQYNTHASARSNTA